MPTILDQIVDHKRQEIAQSESRRPLAEVVAAMKDAPPVRDFIGALRGTDDVSLIAEVKKASPSAGLIRADFDAVGIARTYAEHGAAAISVLTDEAYFQGHLDYLRDVRSSVPVPVLRKDFLLDPYQVYEARAAGADAVLLIAECLDDATMAELFTLGAALGMASLVELYEPENLERVLRLGPSLVGVNNRNLKTFVTDLGHSLRLRRQVPADVVFVSESGIRSRADVERLKSAGVNAMLVGETLMRQPDIATAVDALLGRE